MGELLERAQTAPAPQARGRALEQASIELFTSMPGVLVPGTAIVDYSRTVDVEVLFPNVPSKTGLWFFERAFLCRCKPWNTAVAAPDIAAFARAMRKKNCRYGVLISSHRFSRESRTLASADKQVAHALADGYEVVVLHWEDITAIRSTRALRDYVQEKWITLKTFQKISA